MPDEHAHEHRHPHPHYPDGYHQHAHEHGDGHHPDLDPFAPRDAEPDADEQPADLTPVVLHAGAYFVFHQRAGDDAHHFVLYSTYGDALASGVASFDHTDGPRVLGLTVDAVQLVEGRAAAVKRHLDAPRF